MIKKMNNFLLNKKGMSLVEVLTAMTILTLMIFCFAPLMLSYMETINIAGDKMERVYKDTGNLEVLLGKNSLDGNYTVSIDTVPIKLTSPEATIEDDNGNSQSVATATIESFVKAYGLTSGGTFLKDNMGKPSADGNINISTGQATFYTDKAGSASGITLFPSSLTDDFKVAYITIYSADINFVLSQCEFVTTGPTSEIKLTKGVDYDIEYHPDRKNPTDTNILLLTVYGGGDKISFETSPLVFKHLGQRYEIQIDAPSMIMVGEKAPDNNYYYYVSRGELDEDGNLLIHRRQMNTTSDPKDATVSQTNPITLNAAMNDVEWVPAENADAYAKDGSGDTYGYYVMCGDHGQIRRFWKRPDTRIIVDGKTVPVDGNYYWGGDYTYYTDYNLNRFGNGTYIYTEDENGNPSKDRVYGTDTSFKYIAMRPMFWSTGDNSDRFVTGFNMGVKKHSDKKSVYLRNLCTVSVTSADEVQFYGSDGLVFPYVTSNSVTTQVPNPDYNPEDCDSPQYIDQTTNYNPVTDKAPSYNQITGFQNSAGEYDGRPVQATSSLGLRSFSNEAWSWLDPKEDTISYYRINGLTDDNGKITVDTKSYPITLTSVDAICISNAKLNTEDGTITGNGVYETVNKMSSNSHYFTTGVTGNTSGDSTKADEKTIEMKTQHNLQYPASNYVLYCGYIPAYMDAWGGMKGDVRYPSGFEFAGDNGQYAKTWDINANRNVGQYSNIGRASNRQQLGDNTEYNTLWRMTMGVTPFYTDSELLWDKTGNGIIGYQVNEGSRTTTVAYYPYTNLSYAITGKYYDQTTYVNNREKINALFPGVSKGLTVASPNLVTSQETSQAASLQLYTTVGNVVDITISYLSHPLAISIAANPTDDKIFDLANNKEGGQVFYWHNRREAITFLDSASTFVPSGENDIPVSLMVGYVLGGTVFHGKNADNASIDVTSVMNNGIVFLRAGSYNTGTHSSYNGDTSEFKTTDNLGYRLDQESNVFHQFYYLNSKTGSGKEPSAGSSVGDMYGANYWQNNQHIIPRSITGQQPTTGNDENNTEYLRAHPMTDTKVTCVAWGVTWDGNPEAMWGTENGTVLSWAVDTLAARAEGADSSLYNDRSVDAEIQSYKWVEAINNKKFYTREKSVLSFKTETKVNAGTFSVGASNYFGFYDKGSREEGKTSDYGFINTLENINDIEFSDGIWIAAGDQGGVGSENNLVFPKKYCAKGAYTGTGENGSWINVRYWADVKGTGKFNASNSTYYWKAVQISNLPNCNIVQINNVNGMWIATGYIDGSNGGSYNDEFDDGETTVISWTYNPLIPYGEEGGWSTNVKMYDGTTELPLSAMGGINSCATRD